MKKLFRKLFPSKEMRAYNKMYRRHRKELVKHAKETHEWDWSWMHDSVIMQIRHMYEYYVAKNNVWQDDTTRLPIVEQLKHVLDLQEELDTLWDLNSVNFDTGWQREVELYKEIYIFISEHVFEWWD